ncbi:MAG TPA: cell wall-binding repeat-containing protein, partial [Acidimicrobiales bacterium]|nr:cell wall-binding repeat-containing protein [Acidimicrobiales bacterium]
SFPDALAVGPVAGLRDSAILLVQRDAVPGSTAVELERLRPQRVVIVGGTAAVSTAVQSAIGELTDGGIERIAGVDRYATALALSRATFPDGAGTVHLVSGAGFADAIVAGPAAGRSAGPVLLVGDSVTPELSAELLRLDPSLLVVVGGESTMPTPLVEQLDSIVPDSGLARASDVDRYSTATNVARRFGAVVETVYLTTGASFPDALAATPAAIADGAPILLLPGDGPVPDAVLDYVRDVEPSSLVVIGGTAAVPDDVVQQLTS